MNTDRYRVDIMSAISEYTSKYKSKPELIIVNEQDIIECTAKEYGCLAIHYSDLFEVNLVLTTSIRRGQYIICKCIQSNNN